MNEKSKEELKIWTTTIYDMSRGYSCLGLETTKATKVPSGLCGRHPCYGNNQQH